MKKLLLKTLFFALPLALIFMGIEIFCRTVPNNYTFKNETIKTKYAGTEILILGGSHTFYGLNPICFSRPAYNFANLSQSTYFDQLLFNKHVDHFKNLKCVILNVEYFTLSLSNAALQDQSRKYYYKGFMDLDVPLVSPLDPKGWMLSLNRDFRENIRLIKKYRKTGSILYCDSNGFGTDYTKEKSRSIPKTLAATLKAHEDYSMDFAINTQRIEDMIAVCQSKNIAVVLVTMPVAKAYRDKINPKKLAKIVATCQSLDAENRNVHYLNLFSDRRFSDADFYDADHLHNEGAVKSSQILMLLLKQF